MMTENMKALDMGVDYLEHHGILGQKWGIRRFHNEDGTWTKEGLERRRERENISDLSYDPKYGGTTTCSVNGIGVIANGDWRDPEAQQKLVDAVHSLPRKDHIASRISKSLYNDYDDFDDPEELAKIIEKGDPSVFLTDLNGPIKYGEYTFSCPSDDAAGDKWHKTFGDNELSIEFATDDNGEITWSKHIAMNG